MNRMDRMDEMGCMDEVDHMDKNIRNERRLFSFLWFILPISSIQSIPFLTKLKYALMSFGLPLVQLYHLFCTTIFFNIAIADANGMEKLSNIFLAPTHYLVCGYVAIPQKEGAYPFKLTHRYSYNENMAATTVAAAVVAPLSFPVGCLCKAVAYLSPQTRQRHQLLVESIASNAVEDRRDLYKLKNIDCRDFRNCELCEHLGYQRCPEDEKVLNAEKKALSTIVDLLADNNIPFWVDCGTCLGAYRYGGVIPWDIDIDIAVLEPDFENVKHALNGLDKNLYMVQDWSSRDKPSTYLKVYVKETHTLIDIYHYAINDKDNTLDYILSNEDNIFLTNGWKERERRYKKPVPIDMVFPLKKAYFDGVLVPVPSKIKEYLQMRYGDNLDPIRVYNPATQNYEIVASHPYWQLSNVY